MKMAEEGWQKIGEIVPKTTEVGDDLEGGAKIVDVGATAPSQNWETYILTAGVGSSNSLTPNTADGTVESTVLNLQLPVGMIYYINTRDPQHEILFVPRDSGGNFLYGIVKVYVNSPTGGQSKIIYAGSTQYMNPSSQLATVGNMRHPQLSVQVPGGYYIRVTFQCATALSNSTSSLMIRMSARAQ
jgi:hypothetical protein